ncbi:hypothetical protein J6590_031641 [Homalodisca vitripennis]|nr:hypothetical protein J6590_031641 [Homalodisca vitripennis]
MPNTIHQNTPHNVEAYSNYAPSTESESTPLSTRRSKMRVGMEGPLLHELLMQRQNGGIRNQRRERVGAEPSSTDKSRKFVDWSEPSSANKP